MCKDIFIGEMLMSYYLAMLEKVITSTPPMAPVLS